MPGRSPRTLVTTLTVVALWALGCDSPEAISTYHVRGQVIAISGVGPDTSITIHHEAVPRFKGRDGHESTMESMKMMFGAGPNVDVKQLAANDKLDFDFQVRWSQSPALLLTRVQKLPNDTPLKLTDGH